MKNEISSKENPFYRNFESLKIFKANFDDAQIKSSDPDELPPYVLENFERRSHINVHPDKFKKGNFKQFLTIQHSTGDITYVAHQSKLHSMSNEVEDTVYLIEFDKEGNELGYGEIRNNLTKKSHYFKDKPFIGFTFTEEVYRRKGLGERRLYLMNALSLTLFGHNLNSSTNLTLEAKRLWEKLHDQGKVRKYKEGKKERFVFI